MQAYAGLMSITGEEEGEPVRTGTSVVDLTTGANAVQGILAALYVRSELGRVNASMSRSWGRWSRVAPTTLLATSAPATFLAEWDHDTRKRCPLRRISTSDGYLVVAVATIRSGVVFVRQLVMTS